MARLTDNDVASLIERLSGYQAPLEQPTLARPALQSSELNRPGKLEEVRARLQALAGEGSLGPLLTQRLAVYLGKPVRCTSGEVPDVSGDGPVYVAEADGVRLCVRLDALLASAIVDAMIGGDGDAPKVGYGSKVARTAAGGVTQIMRVMAQALQLPEPSPAVLDQQAVIELSGHVGGELSVAMHDYGWQAWIGEPIAASASGHIESAEPLVPRPPATKHHQVPALEGGSVEAALERARQGLEEMMGRGVAFEAIQTETLNTPRVPDGWLGMSVTSRGGGTIVLAVNRLTEFVLLKSTLGTDVTLEAGGILVETGAEVILRGALAAFAVELAGAPDDIHHIIRLSDNAVLAELPHQSIVHRVVCGSHSGVLRWLVPEQMLLHRANALGLATEKH